MGAGDAVIVIIFIIIFVVSGLRKLVQSMAEQAAGDKARKPDFEATPSEIEEFLRGLQSARRQQAQSRPPAVQAGQRPTARPQRAPQGAAALWQEEGPVARVAVPEVRPTRTRRRAEPRQASPEPKAERGPVGEALPPAAARAAAGFSPTLKKISLKDAVIWSEILGPPLSMRRRGGRTPHGRDS